MLKRLQKKWGVSASQLIVILCVFAITGTSTAWLTKVITSWVGFTDEAFWLWPFLLRLSMLLFGYQFILLGVAFLFGQFPFFWKYEKKILRSIGIRIDRRDPPESGPVDGNEKNMSVHLSPTPLPVKESEVQIAIFASGTGSNAQQIINYFRNSATVKVSLIACNKPGAGVLTIAEQEQIATLIIEKEPFFRGDGYAEELRKRGIQWIILAGFLWKVPVALIKAFPGRIINIHPALLPKYGGKGMYGHFVHEAVIAAREKESGITIHIVDEQFDHGQPIYQSTCPVDPEDTPESLAKKVQILEHKHYPEVIANLVENMEA